VRHRSRWCERDGRPNYSYLLVEVAEPEIVSDRLRPDERCPVGLTRRFRRWVW